MRTHRYTILLYPDPEDGVYTVLVPALPGCITQGDTLEEAIAMAKEAIQVNIEYLVAKGKPVPEDDENPQVMIADEDDEEDEPHQTMIIDVAA